MAQTLDHNGTLLTVTPIVVPTCDVDVDNVQNLDDEPNDVGGLTAAQLKAEFDKTGADLKTYINDDLIPTVVGDGLTEQARQEAEAERVANEQERVSNEAARESATTGIVAQATEQANIAAAYARQAAAHTDLPITRGTSGKNSLVMGDIVNNKAYAHNSLAEGENTQALAQAAHAEGYGTKAWDIGAHAEGFGTVAHGLAAHAEGRDTEARGLYSHAEGFGTLADSNYSHAEGRGTKAQGNAQHAFGQYNDTAAGCVEVVGNGTADDARSNARTLDWSGNEWLAGKLTMEGTPTADKDAATKKYVDDAAAALVPLVGKGVNLLDNAYFIGGGTPGKFPINQRGVTNPTKSNEVAIDRWYLTGTLNCLSSGIQFSTSGNLIYQKIDTSLANFLNGKEVTVSILFADGTFATGTNTFVALPQSNQYYIADGKVQAVSVTLPFPHLMLYYVDPTAVIAAVKLEMGNRQTLARQVNGSWVLNDPPPNYQQELAKCQRKLLVVRSGGWANYIASYAKSPDTADVGYLLIPTPVTMDAPATVSGGGKIRVTNGTAGFQMDIANLASSITGFSPYVAANMVTVRVPLDHAEAGGDITIPTGFADGGTSDNYIIISAE